MDSIVRKVLGACNFVRSRAFAVGALSLVLAFTIFKVTDLTHAVYIRDGESLTLTYTMKDDVHDILQNQGITVMASDIVHFSGFSSTVAEVEIKRSYPVRITVDGRSTTIETTGQTVHELLDEMNIALKGNDMINMEYEDVLTEGAHLEIKRVDYVTRTDETALPFEILETKSSLLKPGQERILVHGREGKEVATYTQRLEDGKIVFEQLVDRKVIAEPVAQEELVGARTAISPLDFGYKLDENGAPVGYTRVLTEQKATGYSARAGAKTASGRHAVPGYVAVDSSEIPYGTKMYIASPDNAFIYGYAIAADTGTGLIDGVVDIDLFYDSYTESCLNGLRYVNIYILD